MHLQDASPLTRWSSFDCPLHANGGAVGLARWHGLHWKQTTPKADMSIEIQRKPDTALAQTIHIRNHQFDTDVSIAEGGGDEGPSPHDLYDAALGACKALTVMWFAKKKGIAVDDIRTEVVSDGSQERSGVYKLTTKLVISGAFSDAEFAQLTAVAEKCPVHKLMTTVTTEITTQVERAV